MISASSLRRARRCPGSFALPQASMASSAASAGTVRHAALEALVRGGRHGELPEQVRPLFAGAEARAEVAVAWSVSQHRARWLDADGRGYEVAEDELPGRIDVVLVRDGQVAVVDWKGYGAVDSPEENDQLMFYASCVADLHDATEVTIHVAHVPDDLSTARVVTRTVDAFDLEAFRAGLPLLVHRVREQRGRPVPDVSEGDHCRYCPAQLACPAKSGLVALLAGERLGVELDAASDAKAWRLIAAVEPMLRAAKAQVIARAAVRPLDLGDGTVLREVTKEGNEQLDGEVAYAVAAELYGRELADASCERSVSKASLRRAAKVADLPAATVERSVVEEVRKRGGASRPQTRSVVPVPSSSATTPASSGSGSSTPT